MLQRTPMMSRLAAVVLAACLAGAGVASAAPADDLREAQRLYSQGRIQPASDKLEAFLRAEPKDPQGRFLKGLLLTEQKRVAEAIQVFTALTEDYPELPEPYNNLAVLYASQGNYDKARASLELAIQTHPSYATAHENLGDIYAQLASRAYDRALQLDKNNATAQVKLAMVKDLFTPRTPGAPRESKAAVPPAKPEPAPAPRTAEPPKPVPPPVASVQPAPPVATTPGTTAPTRTAASTPAATAPASPAPAAAAPAADAKAEVAAAVDRWARAWSGKDVKGYLAAYAPDFQVPGGESRAAWEKLRTERIERPKSIDVDVTMQSIKVDGDEAVATFRQAYRSDTFRNTTMKTLHFVRSGGRWLIKQERVGG